MNRDVKERLEVVADILDKRAARGATDKQLISWLKHLKTVTCWKYLGFVLDELIDAIKQTPIN